MSSLNAPRYGRLFRSKLLEELLSNLKGFERISKTEDDYFPELGSDDGYIRVDGCKIADIVNIGEFSCYYLIDKSGKAFEREKNNEKLFERELDRCFKESQYVCRVDLHD